MNNSYITDNNSIVFTSTNAMCVDSATNITISEYLS